MGKCQLEGGSIGYIEHVYSDFLSVIYDQVSDLFESSHLVRYELWTTSMNRPIPIAS